MPKIALIRGRYLNAYEMQTYEELVALYQITAFGSLTAFHKNFIFPVKLLPSPIDIISLTHKIGIPDKYIHGILNRLLVDDHYLFGLIDQLKGFDIAHTAETYFHFTHQCLSAKKKGYVKKVVATVWENIPFNNEGVKGRKEFKSQAQKEIDHFIAVSLKAKKALVQEGCDEKKISVIPVGIDTHRFHPRNKNSNKKLCILFSGRLESEKGVFDVIDAIDHLANRYHWIPDRLEAILAGKGSEEKRLKDMILKRNISDFFNISHYPYSQMPSIYQIADIFIAPSHKTKYWQEQFGMVFLEAMASGLPIITTDTGSIKEVTGDAAIYVPVGRIEVLSDILQSLLINSQKRLDLGKKARVRALKYFNRNLIAGKIDKLYQQVNK
ncbi:glycosyltransferase family 4 protein [Candidatus Gottesmanbacteria bacterium]|nr:glycosyltransferase family 4 protein [Candidatus Gottesmanbacteria bacterium]